MFTIILEMPPGIALESIGFSVAIIMSKLDRFRRTAQNPSHCANNS
jgi:hypothetical protein